MFACNSAREPKEEQLTPVDLKVETRAMDQADAANEESVPYQEIEVKPTFNGSDASAFSQWVNSHLTYPEASKAAGEQGRVTLQFTVGSDGVVRDVKVLRSASESLDAEAVRVISSSPDWEPGMQDGKAVAVTYTFPVVFQLR